jgi:hypothetical protein
MQRVVLWLQILASIIWLGEALMSTAIATQFAAGVSIYDDSEPASKEQQTQEILRSNKASQDYYSHPEVQYDDLLRQKYPDLARYLGLLPPEPPPNWPLVLLALLTLLFLVGAASLWKRRRVLWYRLDIPTLPRHVQRGLLRLYLVITVPWVAWFGYYILVALNRYRSVSGAVWSLLIVPIGGPLLYLVACWVIAGFRKPEVRPKADEPPSQRPLADYYPVIARAVSGLTDNPPLARAAPYAHARRALNAQLLPMSAMQIKRERRALEEAIRKVEEESSVRPARTKASTALLVASILLLPAVWIIDPTSISLYWVARLPRR